MGILLLLTIIGLSIYLKLKLKKTKTSRPGDYSTVNDRQAAPQETPCTTLSGNFCYGKLNADDMELDDFSTNDMNSDSVSEVMA